MAAKTSKKTPATPAHWTFLSNHAHVLICLSHNPRILVRELAQLVGITERAVLAIIGDLVDAGVVERQREGRANHYRINTDPPLRHPVERHRTVRDLLAMVLGAAPSGRKRT